MPVESKALKGIDSLLSIVQMPAGVPVGTLAIGKAGAINAALLAAAMLATNDDDAGGHGSPRGGNGKPDRSPKRLNDRSARLDHWHHWRRPARPHAGVAAARLGYKCHIFDPHEQPCAAGCRRRISRAPASTMPKR